MRETKKTKKTTIYIDPTLHKKLVEIAKANKRSFNSEIEFRLEQSFKKKEQ